MAVVYRATDLRLHRPVAIKVLPPDVAFNSDVRTRFIREAQTAAQLNHPNIVPIYSVDDNGGESLVYFVMSFVDGESLGVRLSREGAWPVDQTVRVLRDVADALAYAHTHGVVHRDIKPDNILIDRASGRPLVTDFGIARAAAGETRLTVTGVAVGTPAFMSPEQALGEREVDGRSDLYSLAVVGYHMLVGETPFKASNTPAMLVKHVSERPRPVRERRPDIPAYLAVAIDRALAKRPEDRFADAAEFRDALASGDDSHVRTRQRPSTSNRSAYDPPRAALMPSQSLGPAAPNAPTLSPFPAPPPGLSRSELRQWYKAQRRLTLNQQLQNAGGVGLVVNDRLVYPHPGRFEDRPLEDRVLAFRRSVFAFLGWGAILLGINASMGGVPWFLFPAGVMALNVLRRGGSIWSDGIGPFEAFKKGITTRLRAARAAAGEAPPAELRPDPGAVPTLQARPDDVGRPGSVAPGAG